MPAAEGGTAWMATPLPPTANNNQLANAQRRMSNDGRMRWRTTAADEMWQMEKQQWCGNRQATTVGGRKAMTVLTTTTTKQQSTNVVAKQQW